MPTHPAIISYYTFSIPLPFLDGHVLSPGEATALNMFYSDAVRDRATHWVQSTQPGPVEPPWYGFLSPSQLSAIQAQIDSYCQTYSLSPRPRPLRRSLLQTEIEVIQAFDIRTSDIQSEARRRLRARIEATKKDLP